MNGTFGAIQHFDIFTTKPIVMEYFDPCTAHGGLKKNNHVGVVDPIILEVVSAGIILLILPSSLSFHEMIHHDNNIYS